MQKLFSRSAITLSLSGLMMAIFSPITFAQTTEADILQAAQTLQDQSCTAYEKTDGDMRYTICMQEEEGEFTILSATSSLVEAGDGIGYWFAPEGGISAITFFHSGETFFFQPTSGTLLGALLNNGTIQVDFTADERSMLESLTQDLSAINEILNLFVE